jgi:dTDP-4-dehydrorhamnose 3,5-epimerase
VKVTPNATIPDVLLIEPVVHHDGRGFFLESWHEKRLASAGLSAHFVQDNHSRSRRGTLRGLHYQVESPQGKLVRVVQGEVYDVAVDLRRSSPTFRQWVHQGLSSENHKQLWVPPGFAHGFYVLSETADLVYKCTTYYSAGHDRTVRWNDPDLAIDWPLPERGQPILSAKDASAPFLRDAQTYP